jgi:two-component system, OmpR family, phosphate regulon sensor histidine kinase PhoR
MSLSPRLLGFLIATLITVITVAFLSFVPEAGLATIFVAGAATFFASYIFIYLTIDVLVFQEINKMYETLQQLKEKDFENAKKSLFKSVNPIKKLNKEISNYVNKKQKEVDELKKMEQFRREFIADVSHELKTPIFAAQGFIHTLIDGAKEDPEILDRFLNKAAKSLDGLDALVRDLVTLSQVESGDLKMHFEDVNLLQITEDIIEQLESKAEKRGVKLKIKPKDLEKCLVRADKQRIKQVMTNLIDNAIKYGNDNGKVNIEFDELKKHYLISIEDDGPGIPAEHLNRIFERFYRIDKSRSKETGGTGLGLAIVKHILNAHNTKISVSSQVEKGTKFSFKLQKTSEQIILE